MKTILFVVYHEPTVHMCFNVTKKLDPNKYKCIFVAYEKLAKKALKKRNLPFYDKRKKVSKILEELKPDLIITPHNLNPIGYLFVSNAYRKNIRTLMMHEGGSEQSQFLKKKEVPKKKDLNLPIGLCDLIYLFWFKVNKKLYGEQFVGHVGSEYITVNSVKSKWFISKLLRNTVKPEIFVTGQPRFDDIINNKYNKEDTIENLGLSKTKKKVLLLVSIFVADGMWSKEKMITYILNMIKVSEATDTQLIVGIHPREDEKFYKKIDKQLIVIKDVFHELINACDIVVSLPSTATIETLLLKKPVIIPDFLTEKPYSKELGLNEINSYDDIAYYIGNPNKIKESNIEDFVFRLDGKSSERVANVIEEILK